MFIPIQCCTKSILSWLLFKFLFTFTFDTHTTTVRKRIHLLILQYGGNTAYVIIIKFPKDISINQTANKTQQTAKHSVYNFYMYHTILRWGMRQLPTLRTDLQCQKYKNQIIHIRLCTIIFILNEMKFILPSHYVHFQHIFASRSPFKFSLSKAKHY